jgi:hypothetical protein
MGKKWRTSKNGIKKNKKTKTKRYLTGGGLNLNGVNDTEIVNYSSDTKNPVRIKLNDNPPVTNTASAIVATNATSEPVNVGDIDITLEEQDKLVPTNDNILPTVSNPLSNMFGSLMNTNIFEKINDTKKMVITNSAKIMLKSFLTMLEGLEQKQ